MSDIMRQYYDNTSKETLINLRDWASELALEFADNANETDNTEKRQLQIDCARWLIERAEELDEESQNK